MNIHQRARQLAAAAIDFELDPGERREFTEHLSACEPCRRFDSAVRGDMAALRAISWQPAPAHVREAVAGAVAAHGRNGLVAVQGRLGSPLGFRPFADLGRLAVLLALVAALLLGLALSGLPGGGRYLAVNHSPGFSPASAGPSSGDSVAAFARLVSTSSTIPVCPGADGLQADAGALWFVCGGTIWRADVATRTSRAIVAGSAVAVGPAGLWALGNAAVLKLDPATGAVLARVLHVGGASIGVGSGAVWVVDTSAGAMTRIDPARNRVSATIRVGSNPVGIAVGANAVWVADQRTSTGAPSVGDSLSRIDPTTDTVAATIAVDHGPSPTLFIAGAVWVANDADGSLSGINPLTNSVTRIHLDAPVGAEVLPAAAALDGSWLWVIDAHTGELVVIAPGPPKAIEPSVDPTTASAVERLAVQGTVPGSAADRLQSMAFVAGVLWVSDTAGSLLEIPIQPAP
jgi:virginiamycin B lyase